VQVDVSGRGNLCEEVLYVGSTPPRRARDEEIRKEHLFDICSLQRLNAFGAGVLREPRWERFHRLIVQLDGLARVPVHKPPLAHCVKRVLLEVLYAHIIIDTHCVLVVSEHGMPQHRHEVAHMTVAEEALCEMGCHGWRRAERI
jgi:hypothetical protein